MTIRSRSLSLLTGMASRKNLIELVSQLLKHVELATGSYKLDLVSKIIEMCSGEKYALLTDFVWYIQVLFQLGHMRGLEPHSELLRAQITDVALRVLPVRAHAVRRSIEILLEREGTPSSDPYGDNGRGKHIMPEILPAIAWIIGEYSDLVRSSLSLDESNGDELFLDDNSKGTYHSVIQVVMSASNCQHLPASTQKVYVQTAMKVFAAATADKKVGDAELEASLDTIKRSLPVFMQCIDVEVKERAFTAYQLLVALGLLTSIDNTPLLRDLGDEDSEDSDEKSSAEASGKATSDIMGGDSDLLGMMAQGSLATNFSQKQDDTFSQINGSVASKCRSASETLNYVLKPSPMKPTSAKTQRKKSQSPIGVDLNFNTSVDLSVFSTLIEAENAAMGDRISMESVSFTQQSVLRPQETKIVSSTAPQSFGGPIGSASGNLVPSFQHPETAETTESSGFNSRPNRSDPFYLDTAPSNEGESLKDPSHFGMIQLSESDDNESEPARKKKHKKHKKKKKVKDRQDGNVYDNSQASKPLDIYGSDDEDESQRLGAPPGGSRKKSPGKEFEGLAKIDLTAPLREDEVMPERKHRVVTHAQPQASFSTAERPRKEKKKKNKKEKKKHKERSADHKTTSYDVGDLLELGAGFGTSAPEATSRSSGGGAATTTPSVNPPAGGANAITDAFEDLLGLDSPAPVQLPPLESEAPVVERSSSKRPWMKGHLKVSKSSCSDSVDWSRVSLHYRVSRTNHEQAIACMLVFCVQNHNAVPLSDLTLTLGNHHSTVIGNVGPGSSVETDKVGPFLYNEADAAVDLKGVLAFADFKVSVKIRLPSSLHLTPLEGLSLLDVSNELASQSISSHSTKIKLSQVPVQSVTPMLCTFLRSAEVDSSSAGGSSVVGTLAARSSTGAKIFFLVKVKEKNVKIDIKCTHPQLMDSISEDLKKLLL